MTNATWPALLPLPTRDSYEVAAADVTERTQNDLGIRARQLFSSGPTVFNVTFDLYGDQWTIFEGFYVYTLKQGSQPFDISLIDSNVLTPQTVKFTARPTSKLIGPRAVQVTAQLQSLRSTTVDEGTYYAITQYGGSDNTALALQRLDKFSNSDMPKTPGAA